MKARRHGLRSGWGELGALVAAAVLALSFLLSAFSGRRTDFEQLDPVTTTHVFDEVDGAPIHCRSPVDADSCLDGFAARGARHAALWLGNSQLHAINQWHPGEPSSALLLFRRLRRSGLDLVTFSEPNANLQEHLVLYLYLAQRLPIDVLILPLVFDDTRETGVRADIAVALEDPAVIAGLKRHPIGERILANNSRVGSSDLAALSETVQERSELALTHWLEAHSDLWALRAEARGQMWKTLHDFRNFALGITPTSKRRVIPARYQANLAALHAVLEETRRAGVRTYLYVVPLRSDVAPPYLPDQYADFKAEVERIARDAEVPFQNFESVVPAEYWGVMHRQDLRTGVQLDFMHFQSRGHALLADALGDWIESRQSANPS